MSIKYSDLLKVMAETVEDLNKLDKHNDDFEIGIGSYNDYDVISIYETLGGSAVVSVVYDHNSVTVLGEDSAYIRDRHDGNCVLDNVHEIFNILYPIAGLEAVRISALVAGMCILSKELRGG